MSNFNETESGLSILDSIVKKVDSDDFQVTILKSDLDKYKSRIAELELFKQEALDKMQRLTECHLPSKACKGSGLPQVMLEENIEIAKQFLTKWKV